LHHQFLSHNYLQKVIVNIVLLPMNCNLHITFITILSGYKQNYRKLCNSISTKLASVTTQQQISKHSSKPFAFWLHCKIVLHCRTDHMKRHTNKISFVQSFPLHLFPTIDVLIERATQTHHLHHQSLYIQV
jgi:hypothetical protein